MKDEMSTRNRNGLTNRRKLQENCREAGIMNKYYITEVRLMMLVPISILIGKCSRQRRF